MRFDGEEIYQERQWSFSKEEEFDLNGHPARLTVSPDLGGFSQQSELFVNGSYVEPLFRS